MTSEGAQHSFDRFGPLAKPASPLVLSVPHAGRDYPPEMARALRVPLAALLPLEDRHIDVVARAAHRDEAMLIARRPRAWIDLNRSEQERDPLVEEGRARTALPIESAKLRSGLGLVPRRTPVAGDIWRAKLSGPEVEARIAGDHRPYHVAIADALAAARAWFGIAVLIDIHSMPALGGADPAQLVLGDRFGRSAATRIVAPLARAAQDAGLRVAFNAPYAGGHILDRHADPAAGIHAVQLEFDRTLYLDGATLMPNAGAAALADTLRTMLDAVRAEALSTATMPAAAE
ncbi:N-formylglutamate amidohydrolase [Sphingomonas baiyangensis]|uniref:N-formylglutamate amidohydrolase n=1 Tax=Sphingomonas baiyangensis TaxID=2572576 RepID=A0A4U1KZV0_9SPHN|nr:N-formylglutamate amidohydrolase [Sphingomonas baiyangensis]TKD49957.1 N-formylglutamate amidohydrolase [Sphingomonas baiyangensis]